MKANPLGHLDMEVIHNGVMETPGKTGGNRFMRQAHQIGHTVNEGGHDRMASQPPTSRHPLEMSRQHVGSGAVDHGDNQGS